MQLFHFLKIIVCFFPFFFLDLEKTKDISKENDGATEKMKKQLAIERTMKIQAVNKLAEIMNRKDLARDNSKKRKATSDDLRKKEKECRKLHQELGAVSTHSTRKASVIKPRCTRGCLPTPPHPFLLPSKNSSQVPHQVDSFGFNLSLR